MGKHSRSPASCTSVGNIASNYLPRINHVMVLMQTNGDKSATVVNEDISGNFVLTEGQVYGLPHHENKDVTSNRPDDRQHVDSKPSASGTADLLSYNIDVCAYSKQLSSVHPGPSIGDEASTDLANEVSRNLSLGRGEELHANVKQTQELEEQVGQQLKQIEQQQPMWAQQQQLKWLEQQQIKWIEQQQLKWIGQLQLKWLRKQERLKWIGQQLVQGEQRLEQGQQQLNLREQMFGKAYKLAVTTGERAANQFKLVMLGPEGGEKLPQYTHYWVKTFNHLNHQQLVQMLVTHAL